MFTDSSSLEMNYQEDIGRCFHIRRNGWSLWTLFFLHSYKLVVDDYMLWTTIVPVEPYISRYEVFSDKVTYNF